MFAANQRKYVFNIVILLLLKCYENHGEGNNSAYGNGSTFLKENFYASFA